MRFRSMIESYEEWKSSHMIRMRGGNRPLAVAKVQ